MRQVSSPTKVSAVLGAAVLALSACSGGSSGDKSTAASGAAHASGSSGSSSSSSAPQDPSSITRLGDATKITDNGISPEQLQKDVATPITKAAADKYVATVKPDAAWGEELAKNFGQGATVSKHLDDQKKHLDEDIQNAVKERVFPARCTDMMHLTDAVSRPTGSSFATLHTSDDKVAVIYSKLGKGTMPLEDIFVDYMTCSDARITSGDGRSAQQMYRTLPLRDTEGTTAYTISTPMSEHPTRYVYIAERNGVRLTTVSNSDAASRKDVQSALEHGADLLPKTAAPGVMAARHKQPADFTDPDKLMNDKSLGLGPGKPVTIQPRYSEAWSKALLNATGAPWSHWHELAKDAIILYLYPSVAAEYNRETANESQQECLPSSDLEYVALGGGISALRGLTPKTAWFLSEDKQKMGMLVALTPGASTQDAPMKLEDVFKNANRCTSVTFTAFGNDNYSVGYSFTSFTTSGGQKAYMRTITKNEDIMPYKYVAMTDVDNVRVTVWSQSDKDLKTDLEKAIKAAKQQPKS